MSNRTRRMVAVLGAAALTVPSAAVAAPGKGKAPAESDTTTKTETRVKAESRVKAKSKAKAKKVKLATYVVKGVYDEAGQVDVTSGNSHAKRAGLIRQNVSFDFRQAKLVVADTNADGTLTEADLQAGDKVVVQLKLPRALGDGPYAARKVVDKTHPPVDADESQTETGTEGTADAPAEAPAPTDGATAA